VRLVLVRASLLLTAAGLALASAGCDALTRPNEIQIVAELPAPPKPAAPPQGAQAMPGGARGGMPAPGGGQPSGG
jgi:hypothetical protein